MQRRLFAVCSPPTCGGRRAMGIAASGRVSSPHTFAYQKETAAPAFSAVSTTRTPVSPMEISALSLENARKLC
ncbi:hypothetical protein TcasGA2_TC032867 [Tribolium castaneum]|uniref:Uncharacterized protein n=1 Tax=Tribolium castaneum TaxID=7070 RepID=A0A139WJI1_TRICA|nr:hypothetical protein TcasGA2_TC032867 [Tribolium castaneum]